MKNLLIATIVLLSQCESTIASTHDPTIVKRSIGQLLLSHDQKFSYQKDDNPFGSTILYDEFVKVFNNEIKTLPTEDRVNFLWAAMWHLDFDGHSMMQFQMLVAENCGDAFVSRLETYVAKESELKRNKTRLYFYY